MQRKLIKHGPSSTILALPVQWVRDQKLKAGDSISVIADGDKLIITGNEPSPLSEITVNIEGFDKNSLVLIIRSAYRMGYGKLVLQYSGKELKNYGVDQNDFVTVVVNEELNRLIGFEITEQKENELVIQEITKPTAQELLTLYRKVFSMTRQVILHAINSDEQDVGIEARYNIITKIVSYAFRIMAVGEANLSKIEKMRMTHSLILLELIAGIFKINSDNIKKQNKEFSEDLALAFIEVEKVVFMQDRTAITSFQEINHRLSANSGTSLFTVVDILFEILLLHVTE